MPKTHEEIMELFTEDELIEGKPTTDGLRRVVQEVIGPIISSHSRVVVEPVPQNKFNYVIEHTLDIWDKEIKRERQLTELADVNPLNTADPYIRHPAATGSTKAEGRALRKLLGLKKIITAEEAHEAEGVTEDMLNSVVWSPEVEYDIEKDINGLYLLCEKLDINVVKFVNSGKDKYESLRDIPENKMMEMKEFIQKYQQGKQIPAKIKGFIPRD